MGRPKDVHGAVYGSQTTTNSQHDALDDANDAHVLLVSATQRIIPILGGLKLDPDGNTVLYYRLGESAAHS